MIQAFYKNSREKPRKNGVGTRTIGKREVERPIITQNPNVGKLFTRKGMSWGEAKKRSEDRIK